MYIANDYRAQALWIWRQCGMLHCRNVDAASSREDWRLRKRRCLRVAKHTIEQAAENGHRSSKHHHFLRCEVRCSIYPEE